MTELRFPRRITIDGDEPGGIFVYPMRDVMGEFPVVWKFSHGRIVATYRNPEKDFFGKLKWREALLWENVMRWGEASR